MTKGLQGALDHYPEPARPDEIKIREDVEPRLVELTCITMGSETSRHRAGPRRPGAMPMYSLVRRLALIAVVSPASSRTISHTPVCRAGWRVEGGRGHPPGPRSRPGRAEAFDQVYEPGLLRGPAPEGAAMVQPVPQLRVGRQIPQRRATPLALVHVRRDRPSLPSTGLVLQEAPQRVARGTRPTGWEPGRGGGLITLRPAGRVLRQGSGPQL